jgi:hypothetical protein
MNLPAPGPERPLPARPVLTFLVGVRTTNFGTYQHLSVWPSVRRPNVCQKGKGRTNSPSLESFFRGTQPQFTVADC